MQTILPNNWYHISDVLPLIARRARPTSIVKKVRYDVSPHDSELTRIIQRLDCSLNEYQVRFQGSNLVFYFDREALSVDNLLKEPLRDIDGNRIYMPQKNMDDISGLYIKGCLNPTLRTGKFAPLTFLLEPAKQEDIVDKESYKYNLLIKGENGIFICDTPSIAHNEFGQQIVDYSTFRPFKSKDAELGQLYVTTAAKEFALLQMKLEDKELAIYKQTQNFRE